MMRTLILAGLLLAAMPSLAGDPVYPVAAIPAALKEKAHAVKRMEELRVKVSNPGEMVISHHYVITVLEPAGDRYARLVMGYDKLREPPSIHGALYDAGGRQVKKLKQGDIEDVSGVGSSLMTDDRLKRHTFFSGVYPYTIEYETEQRYNTTYMLPDWTPQEDEHFAVEQSRLQVTVPDDYTLRYRSFHYNGEPAQLTEKRTRTYTWEVKPMQAITAEWAAPEWYTRTTTVLLAPDAFEMEKYKGSMASWEALGRFAYTLNKGRDALPEHIRQTVHKLTDGLQPREKIEVLYRYLQQNTRYISVQLGIGGLQTFDAAYVAARGYGDCKALSNYMCALLKEAGVRALYAWVYAGEGKTGFVPDFPSDQFNHVIVCVPQQQDTTWLECTSQLLPAGYLSGFTANRPVLLVDETGGRLVRTPDYSVEQNRQLRRINATIDESGNMQAQCFTSYTGQQQDNLQGMLHALTREKLLEQLKKGLPLPSYDVGKYECREKAGQLPVIDEELHLAAHHYATITGKRMFIEPNILNRSIQRITADGPRTSDIRLQFAYRDADTVQIQVPPGYAPEALPKDLRLQNRFGSYTATLRVQDSTITYVRVMERRAGQFPAAAFEELEGFYDAVYRADRCRVVLVRK